MLCSSATAYKMLAKMPVRGVQYSHSGEGITTYSGVSIPDSGAGSKKADLTRLAQIGFITVLRWLLRNFQFVDYFADIIGIFRNGNCQVFFCIGIYFARQGDNTIFGIDIN
jgi:hypothetical protein